MKKSHPSGLGEPVAQGKMALFQPPQQKMVPLQKSIGVSEIPYGREVDPKSIPQTTHRIRTTIDLTSEALVILQKVQQEHRLKTGRAMPIWKALSEVIVAYKERR